MRLGWSEWGVVGLCRWLGPSRAALLPSRTTQRAWMLAPQASGGGRVNCMFSTRPNAQYFQNPICAGYRALDIDAIVNECVRQVDGRRQKLDLDRQIGRAGSGLAGCFECLRRTCGSTRRDWQVRFLG
jgi:hypothetical protein